MMLGERIKNLRLEHKLSQEKLAELLGVSRQAVTKWEKGLTHPSTANLFKMAEIFETSVDLMTKEDEKAHCGEKTDEVYRGVEKNIGKEALRRLKIFGIVLLAYYIFFVTCKLALLDLNDTSLSAVFFSPYAGTKTNWNYLASWLWSSNLYWYSALISAVPALFGAWRCSAVSCFGMLSGMILGEIFGKNPAGAFYGFSHYGWAIWGAVFVISIIMGAVLQKKKIELSTEKGKIWLIAYAAMVIAAVFLIKMSMPTHFGA